MKLKRLLNASFQVILALFLTWFLVSVKTDAKTAQGKCEDILNVLFKVGPKDIPGKCYVGTLVPGLFEIIQWIDNDEALGELRAEGISRMMWLILHTDIEYFRPYKFIYRGTRKYITVIGAIRVIPVFDVFSLERKDRKSKTSKSSVTSYIVLLESGGLTTIKIDKLDVNKKSVTVRIGGKKCVFPLSRVVGILRVEKEDKKKETCSLELLGRYKNLGIKEQVRILDSICVSDISGIRVKRKTKLDLE